MEPDALGDDGQMEPGGDERTRVGRQWLMGESSRQIRKKRKIEVSWRQMGWEVVGRCLGRWTVGGRDRCYKGM